MESWKQQLTDVSRSSEGGDDSDAEGDDGLRARQAQAWRSVGALQLRVEQLTLEVTKVRKYWEKNLVCRVWLNGPGSLRKLIPGFLNPRFSFWKSVTHSSSGCQT